MLPRLRLIDSYLAKSIAVPLIGSLILAAMLLLLDKMLRLFQYVVDAGGPVSVVWRMLANLLPEYLVARDPDRADARNPARLPEARAVSGARRAARNRRRLRPPAARSLRLCDPARALQPRASSATSSPTPSTNMRSLRFDLNSGALGAAIKVGEFNRLGKAHHACASTAVRRREPSSTESSSRPTTGRARPSPPPPSAAVSFRPTIPTRSCSG